MWCSLGKPSRWILFTGVCNFIVLLCETHCGLIQRYPPCNLIADQMIFYGAPSEEAGIVSKINPTPGERNTLLARDKCSQTISSPLVIEWRRNCTLERVHHKHSNTREMCQDVAASSSRKAFCMFLLSRLNQGLDLGRFLLRQLRREILKSWHLSSIGIYPSTCSSGNGAGLLAPRDWHVVVLLLLEILINTY